MKFAADLHIHSALSPCGHRDMTPNNIVNMAWIKGLDVIAITDHNSAENVKPVISLAKKRGIVVIPGMEVQSREEVHLLCYFPALDQLLDFQQLVYHNLEGKNSPDFFGEQWIMDEQDRVIGRSQRLLIGSTGLSANRICREVARRGGKVVPAHVDRKSFSIISNLGFIPPDLDISTVEISRNACLRGLTERFPYLKKYKILRSSDAHRLEDILEREFFLEADGIKIKNIVDNI